MFESFWYGIFGGLFGPVIAKWLSRFKYWVIFFFTTLGCMTLLFSLSIYARGWNETFRFFFTDTRSILLFIFVPLGLGLCALVVAFLNTPKNNRK